MMKTRRLSAKGFHRSYSEHSLSLSPSIWPSEQETDSVAEAAMRAATGMGSMKQSMSVDRLSFTPTRTTVRGMDVPKALLPLILTTPHPSMLDPSSLPEKVLSPVAGITSRSLSSSAAMTKKKKKKPRLIIASYRLPLTVTKCSDDCCKSKIEEDEKSSGVSSIFEESEFRKTGWKIEWDSCRNFLANLRVLEKRFSVHFVGWPGIFEDDLSEGEREELCDVLYELRYPCHPVFLTCKQKRLFYDECCRSVLWPMFHYLMPSDDISLGQDFHTMWQAYENVNMLYARTAILATDIEEMMDAADDCALFWFHNYHLALASAFVRHKRPNAKIGFFMHIVFPTSEILRVLPIQREFLRGMLSSDLIGFHTFDYARHFLSACKRQLDLDFQTQADDGTLVTSYLGRDVGIRISHVSIPSQLVKTLGDAAVVQQIADQKWKRFAKGRKLVVGVGDITLSKGTVLALKGLHAFLKLHPKWATEVALVFILRNKMRTILTDGESGERIPREMISAEVASIRLEFGEDMLELYEETNSSHNDLLALYRVADLVVFGSFWDGFNTMPYELTAVQGSRMEPAFIVMSQFMGSSRSLSGVMRINPWDLNGVARAIHEALLMNAEERREAHKRRYKHVMSYTLEMWATQFLTDLVKTAKKAAGRKTISMGMGATLVNVMLDRHLQKLRDVKELLTSSFQNASKRVLLFDYGGTLAKLNDKAMGRPGYIPLPLQKQHQGADHSLSSELIPPPRYILKWLENLAARNDTIVCVVSGHTRGELDTGFPKRKRIAFAAEKGAFFKWPGSGVWTPAAGVRLEDCRKWQALAMPVLLQYTARTDGSYIQKKDTALVWHYHDSDPEYGDIQANELGRHLRRVLMPAYNVNVQKYDHAKILEILPADIHKGAAAMAVINKVIVGDGGGGGVLSMATLTDEDFFLLAVGDDRSDEKMFESLQSAARGMRCEANTYTCTIGIQPTNAHYFLTIQSDIEWLLSTLASCTEYRARTGARTVLSHISSLPVGVGMAAHFSGDAMHELHSSEPRSPTLKRMPVGSAAPFGLELPKGPMVGAVPLEGSYASHWLSDISSSRGRADVSTAPAPKPEEKEALEPTVPLSEFERVCREKIDLSRRASVEIEALRRALIVFKGDSSAD